MAKVTVLTAVYNAENYLRQCLDSLKSQTLVDCQFICIDDCSTDSSYAILQEYVQMDKRFQVVRTPVNSGIAVTRNLGLQFARGEYITMLDADDWFSPDALEKAYDMLVNGDGDCVLFQLIMHEEKNGHESIYPIKSTQTSWSGEDAFRMSLAGDIHGLYVAKADFYRHFPYDTTSPLYSDENSTHLHYLNANTVTMCNGKYYYRQHTSSLTHACSIRRFDRMAAQLSMKRQLKQLQLADKQNLLNSYETHRWLNVVGCYWYYRLHRDAFKAEEHQEIQVLFTQMLQTIEPQRIPWSLKGKLGYYPFRSYRTFCFWEDLYFRLRELLGR